MKSLMHRALGHDWEKLPSALQAHYHFGTTVDEGHMDITYPRFMQPVLTVLKLVGALINRCGEHLPTRVEKSMHGERQYWRRTISYPSGKVIHFNSYWVVTTNCQIIEYVNPFLGLRMAPWVENDQLHYRGVCFVVKLGSVLIPVPEWLVLGHTTIREKALDQTHFEMDFRLTHPVFGEVFRYSGQFEADIKPERKIL